MARDSSFCVAALADPVTRAAGFALIQFAVWALADADIVDGLNGGGLAALTRFVWMAVVTVCVVPVVAVASIGEIARVRVLPWVCRRHWPRRGVRTMAYPRSIASAKSSRL